MIRIMKIGSVYGSSSTVCKKNQIKVTVRNKGEGPVGIWIQWE